MLENVLLGLEVDDSLENGTLEGGGGAGGFHMTTAASGCNRIKGSRNGETLIYQLMGT